MYISGGENVYPAEVEEVLIGHEAIAEVAAIGVPDRRWGETGTAFVVARPGLELEVDELARYCPSRLAPYKIPRHYRIVAELPYLSRGKVDKRTLRHQVSAVAAGGPG